MLFRLGKKMRSGRVVHIAFFALFASIATIPPAAAAKVAMALVLAVDVSESVDAGEYELQHEGIARAFENIRGSENGRIQHAVDVDAFLTSLLIARGYEMDVLTGGDIRERMQHIQSRAACVEAQLVASLNHRRRTVVVFVAQIGHDSKRGKEVARVIPNHVRCFQPERHGKAF